MREFSREKRARAMMTAISMGLVLLLASGTVLNRAMAAGTDASAGSLKITSTGHFDPICFDCGGGMYFGCAETQHIDDQFAFPSYFKDDESNVHPTCTASPDTDHLCQQHNWCTFGKELQEEAEQLMKEGNPESLVALVAENQANLKVDLVKKELTVIGCEGKPIAALRLTRAQVRALESKAVQN